MKNVPSGKYFETIVTAVGQHVQRIHLHKLIRLVLALPVVTNK